MPKDFSAHQIRATQLIGSGGLGGKKLGLAIYSASMSSDYAGAFGKDSSMLSGVGSDVFLFVSGSVDSKISKSGTGNGQTGVSLFGGDVVVSGTFYAERIIAEVDETTTGSLNISGSLVVSRSAEIRENLTVFEDSTFNKDIYIADDLWVSGGMRVGKSTIFDGDITVAEDSTFSKDLKVADDLWVSGGMRVAKPATFDLDGTFSSDLYIADDLWVSGGMKVAKASAFDNTLSVAEDVTLSKDVYIADDLWVSGGVKVSKPSTFDNTLTVTEDGTFSKDLYVADDLWVSGGMKVSKSSVFDGDITVAEDSTFSKDLYIADDLWVSGGIRVGKESLFDNIVTVAQILNVTQQVNANSTANATSKTTGALVVDGGVGIAKKVHIGQETSIEDSLFVSGTVSATTLTAAEDSTFSKDLHIVDDLWVSGGMKVAKAANFDNLVSVGLTLSVTEDATFSKDVKIVDDLYVSGNMKAETLILNEGTLPTNGVLSLVASGSAIFEKDLTVNDDLWVSGGMKVANQTTFDDDSTFLKDLYVTDDLWVSGAMKVSKPSAFDNTLTVAEDGSFSKDLYVADDLWVSGSATLAQLSIVGDFYVPDDLWVSGGIEAAHGYIVNKLKVGNGSGHEELRISAGNTSTGSLVFSKNNGESGEITFDTNENIVVQNNANNDDIIFKVTDNSTLTEVMRIDGASSTVAIGATSNSVAKLLIDVTDGDNDHGIKIEQNDAGERAMWIDSEGAGIYMTAKDGIQVVVDQDNGYGFLTSRNNATVNAPLVKIRDQLGDESALKVIQESADTSAFAIEIANAGGTKTTISGSGQVGIGTGTSTYDATLQVKSLSQGKGILLQHASSTDTVVKIYDSSDDGVVDVYANNAVTSRIHGNGMSFVGGDLQVTGTNLDVAEYIRHLGDSDTYIQFGADVIRYSVGGKELANFNEAESTIAFNNDNDAINTIIKTDTKLAIAAGTPLGAGKDQVLIMSGGAASSFNEAASNDVLLYVSGAIGSKGTATRGTSIFGGDLLTSGSIDALMGFSGSLTRLTTGESFIQAGANITVTSASNGQIVIASAGASGDITSVIAGSGLQGGATSGDATLAVNDSVIATVTGSNTFAEDQVFSKDIKITDDLWVSGGMKVAKPATFDLDGTFSSDLYVADDLWVSGGMKVAKASAFDNTLSVAEDATFSKDVYVADDLWVSGAISTNLFQHFAPKFVEGLSGSITNLIGGTSYIAAGTNITVTSASK